MTTSHNAPRPLTASLLAQKGAARPSQPVVTDHGAPRHLFDVPMTDVTVTDTPVADVPVAGRAVASTSTPKQDIATQKGGEELPKQKPGLKKAAFTFRMCEQRHFRLRLLSAHQNRSSQKILEEALDAYLDSHAPQTAGMACPCFQGSEPEG